MKKIFLSILLIFYFSCYNLEKDKNNFYDVKITWDDIHIERVVLDNKSISSGQVINLISGEYQLEILYYYDKNTFTLTKENRVSNIVYRKLLIEGSVEYYINKKYEVLKVKKLNTQGEDEWLKIKVSW